MGLVGKGGARRRRSSGKRNSGIIVDVVHGRKILIIGP